MSRRWIQNPNRCADEYLDGIEDFIEFARRHNPGATRIRCPCRRCNNTLFETIENVGFHLKRPEPPSSPFLVFLLRNPISLRRRLRPLSPFVPQPPPCRHLSRLPAVAFRRFVPNLRRRFSLLRPPFSTPEMSDLIRRGRSMTSAPSSDPPAQSASAATAPALLDHVVVGPGASRAPASSASSVAQPASARRRHGPTDTIDTTSTDGTGASGSQPGTKFRQARVHSRLGNRRYNCRLGDLGLEINAQGAGSGKRQKRARVHLQRNESSPGKLRIPRARAGPRANFDWVRARVGDDVSADVTTTSAP
ncbi:hypothetical protein L3X38_014107 [Prunus dulcis]|uniref:Transposase-associated domain-containing protein n=1 Tax=Prunus dulcis TaxID=3755 RepID=A0AAD4WN57_PRUDU|nr:hypothetical protein L3X38_014107 [Prunus dulcis]